MAKAVALLSGGLDSTLAVKMMIDQGVEVVALNFTSSFCNCNSGGASKGGCKSQSARVASEYGVPIKVITKGLDYIEIVRNPKYGYGQGMNPCVDCRMFMFIKAREYMEEIGADFIITGEVIGQRPMSQRRDVFDRIERECGLEGLILRPLCAGHLPPTRPEIDGLVDRDRLMNVSGRSRRELMDKAEELDIRDYPCPSGGCLLTDKIFAKKVRDLLDHKAQAALTTRDLQLLKAGRHFRYHGVKVVVGRDEADNRSIKNLAQPGDTIVEPVDFPGPLALVSGESANGAVDFAASLVMKYSSGKFGARCIVRATGTGGTTEFEVLAPAAEATVEETRVC